MKKGDIMNNQEKLEKVKEIEDSLSPCPNCGNRVMFSATYPKHVVCTNLDFCALRGPISIHLDSLDWAYELQENWEKLVGKLGNK